MEGDGLRLTRNVLNIWWSKNLKDNGVAFKMRLNFLWDCFIPLIILTFPRDIDVFGSVAMSVSPA